MFEASLNTPLMVTEKSASSNSRSIPDELTPVTSWTPLGVLKSIDTISFEIVRADPPESSTATVIPNPDSLAIRISPLCGICPAHKIVPIGRRPSLCLSLMSSF